MNELTTIPHARELKDVTRDIRYQTGQFLRTAIEIGRLLFEAKDMVPYGQWGKYIEEELPFSHSWANNYMRLYKEFGQDQMSMFGDSQVFMNLTPSNALEILKLPEEDRARFVAEKDAASMSLTELEKEVKAELEQTQAALRDAQQEKLDLQQQVAALKAKDSQKKLEDMTAKAKAAEDKAKDSQKKLKELQKNPQVPESVMEEMRQQAQAKADKKAAADAQKELDKLAGELRTAQAARVAAEEALGKVQKEAKVSGSDAAVFKLLFEQVQTDFNKLTGQLKKVRLSDPDLGRKFTRAVEAMLENMALAAEEDQHD